MRATTVRSRKRARPPGYTPRPKPKDVLRAPPRSLRPRTAQPAPARAPASRTDRRNRTLRLSCEIHVAEASFARQAVVSRSGLRGVVGASVRIVPVGEHIPLDAIIGAVAAANLTPEEAQVFRDCLLPMDAGEWIVRPDATGYAGIRTLSIADYARRTGQTEEAVHKTLNHAMAKIRRAQNRS